MLNSLSGRNDNYSRSGAIDSIYARASSVQSAGLSARTLTALTQLSPIDRISSSNLRLSNLNSLNSLASETLQRRSNNTTVFLSTAAKIQSAFSTLNADLKALASTATRDPLQLKSSDPNIVRGTAISGGAPASEKVITVQQLAQAQLSQSSAMTSASELIGAGQLTIEFGPMRAGIQQAEGAALQVEISASDTLASLARKIESATPALRASVMSDQQGARLQLESAGFGAAQAFTVAVSGVDKGLPSANLAKLALDVNAAQASTQLAQDAKLSIDGRELIAPANSVRDTPSNFALELRQQGTSAVSLARDTDQLNKNILQLLERFNNARAQLGAMIESGVSRITADRITLNKATARLDNVITNLSQDVSGQALGDFGISVATDGKLLVNQTRLTQQVDAMPEVLNQWFNSAVGQLSEASKPASQDALSALRPLQLARTSLQSANTSYFFNANGSAEGSSNLLGLNLRGLYGVSQYLLVSQMV